MTLSNLINDYNSTYKIGLEKGQKYLQSLSEDDLLKSLRNFGSVTIDGKSKQSPHFKNNQWFNREQPKGSGVQLRDVLIEEIKNRKILSNGKIKTFDSIFNEIEAIVAELRQDGIMGAGQMTIYDVSLYLGAKMKIYPNKVFVHRGVRSGAFALNITDSKNKNHILELSDVFKEAPLLKKLKSAKHIENFLCIKKNELKGLSSADKKR